MKYTINFYLDELKPKVHYLTLKNTVIITLLVGLLLGGWQGLLAYQNHNQQARLNLVRQDLDAASNRLEILKEDLIKHNDKAMFNQRKQRLEQSLQAKNQLLQIVGQGFTPVALNFHTALAELSRLHDNNIWLTEFEFGINSASFSGFSLDSSSVTRWMTKLQDSESFTGREFSQVNIKAFDRKALAFVVATSNAQGLDLPTLESVATPAQPQSTPAPSEPVAPSQDLTFEEIADAILDSEEDTNE